MIDKNEIKLVKIINEQDWLIKSLRDVRTLNLPDWYIAAGAIRNTVWNYFHQFPTTFHQQDVDVIYFNSSDIDKRKEKFFEGILSTKSPYIKWEVKNQARKNTQVNSSCESISYWIETATCVGVRLENDDKFTVCSPHGLDDLMNLIVCPIPKSYQTSLIYKQRIKEKNWEKFWPKLKIRLV